MREEPKLQLKIEHKSPLAVLDLAQCLSALTDEHKRFVESTGGISTGQGVQLYIREVKTGSFIAELAALTPLALPFMEHAVTILDFCAYLKMGFCALLQDKHEAFKPQKSDLENFTKILEPVAKDKEGHLSINGTYLNQAPVNIQINYLEANAAQNTARRMIDDLKTATTGIHEKVLLYWYQARNDQKSQRGDRAIIESISRNPVKTIFMSDSIKGKMLLGAKNPFKRAFIVTVAVETIEGKPALYRITDVHESIPRGELTNLSTGKLLKRPSRR